MVEKRVSVRLVATGSDSFRAELRGIGSEGARALGLIEAAGPRAAAGMAAANAATGEAARQMEQIAQRAAHAAAALRGVGAASESVVERIDRMVGATGRVGRSAEDFAVYGRALDDMRARFNPAFATIRSYRQALGEIRQAHRVGAISADEMAAAIARERQAALASLAAHKGRATAIRGSGESAAFAANRMRNLGFQINDIGVSLVGGMNPFVVMAQQGTQIAQIYGMGGGGVAGLLRDVRTMAVGAGRAVLGIATRFPLVTAAVGLGTAAIGLMRREIQSTTGEQVSFGNVARATWQIFAENVYQIGKPVFDTIRGWWDNAVSWANWAFEGIVDGVIWMGDLVINAFKVAAAGATYAFQGLPDAVGALAVAAANAVVNAVNWMIERAIAGINAMLEFANDAMAKVGLDPAFETVEPGAFTIDEIANPYAARDAERRAALVAQVRGIVSESPLSEFFGDVRDRALDLRVTPEDPSAGGGGGGRAAADEVAEAAEVAARGWDAVAESLRGYAEEAMNWGSAIGESLAGAFRGAEDAFGEWVKTGKADFRDLTASILADLAKIAFRRFVLGPVANALSNVFSGGFLGGAIAGALQHSGGRAGSGLPVMIDSRALAFAPRLHAGGRMMGPDEYPAILQRGERVLNRAQTREWEGGGGTTVNIYARDAESFRGSRAQVAADLARAVAYGRRGS